MCRVQLGLQDKDASYRPFFELVSRPSDALRGRWAFITDESASSPSGIRTDEPHVASFKHINHLSQFVKMQHGYDCHMQQQQSVPVCVPLKSYGPESRQTTRSNCREFVTISLKKIFKKCTDVRNWIGYVCLLYCLPVSQSSLDLVFFFDFCAGGW